MTLYLLAAHAAGDFPLQTDRMATKKFEDRWVRAAHVSAYTLAFQPVLLLSGWPLSRVIAFSVLLWATHYAIDSRRWNEAVPVWYDQALHVIALAVAVAISGWFA